MSLSGVRKVIRLLLEHVETCVLVIRHFISKHVLVICHHEVYEDY